MGPKPFARLPAPREVDRADFPPDLAHFYAHNEAIEFNGLEYGSLYLYPLAQVKRMDRVSVGLDHEHCPDAWKDFDALRIGRSCFGEDILYVIRAPCCPSGAILVIGGPGNLPEGGSGGQGVLCLVLGASFSEWLWHLEGEGWWEYFLGGGMLELPLERQRKLRAYYLALNPNIEWPEI